MEFRVLGALEVVDDDAPVTPGSHRQRTLLARLLVEAGSVVPVDVLAEALWPDALPADPRNAVQTYVARLREALGDDAPLVTRPPGYVLQVGTDQVDALRFGALVDEARDARDDPARARDLLDRALALWRGRAYEEFEDGVAWTEALRLEERRLAAVEERAAAMLALGEAATLVGELEAAVADHPLRERLVDLHMRALAATDRPAEALTAYRAYRDRLAGETGLEPSPSIRALETRILQGDLASTAPQTPSVAPSRRGAPTPTIPTASTSLVGRDRALADVRAALDQRPVVTLTGPGGVGKTRIAAEVARTLADEGSDEVVGWVELSPLSDPSVVDRVVAAALGIDLAGGLPPREALVDALAGWHLLLVVDNAEHLLEAVGSLVDAVRRGCPHVRLLVTSRERLAVEGERVVELTPLPVVPMEEDAPAPAVRLFLDRATDVGGGAVADVATDLATVSEICRELDGLPLAIELAAARTTALAPSDLLAGLREGVPAVVGVRRGQPERHRDLWAVVDWSYRLLEDDERRLFDRLGVFAGAVGVDEVHEVCAPDDWPRSRTVDVLAALVDRSLVRGPDADPGGRGGRYHLLRTLRAFARQRLADRDELATFADRHARVFTALAERAAGPPLTEDGRRWLERSVADLREAASRARRTRDVTLLGRLVAAVHRFDYWRPGGELLAWADDVLALDGGESGPDAPRVHAAAAAAAWKRGDLARAERLARRATRLGAGPDDGARTLAFEALGDVSTFAGRLDDADAAYREVVRLARLHDDADSEALGLASRALVLAYGGRVEEAVTEVDAAVAAAEGAGAPARAFVRFAQGECLVDVDPHRATAIVDEATALARGCEAWFVEGVALLTATSLRARHGDPATAVTAFGELVRHWHRSGSWTQQWTTLRNLAELLVRLGMDEPAVALASAAEGERTAPAVYGEASRRLDAALSTARDRLGTEAFEAARARGRRLAPGDVVALALATVEEAAAHHPRTRR